MASRCHIRQYSSEGLIYLLNSKQMINYILVSSYMVLGHSSKLESFLSRPPFYILGKEYTFLGRPRLKNSYIVYSFIEAFNFTFSWKEYIEFRTCTFFPEPFQKYLCVVYCFCFVCGACYCCSCSFWIWGQGRINNSIFLES